MYPLLCRLFGHKMRHELVYGGESAGLAMYACTRRNCGFIGYTFTMHDYKIIGH